MRLRKLIKDNQVPVTIPVALNAPLTRELVLVAFAHPLPVAERQKELALLLTSKTNLDVGVRTCSVDNPRGNLERD